MYGKFFYLLLFQICYLTVVYQFLTEISTCKNMFGKNKSIIDKSDSSSTFRDKK